jgi:hypothetical protein
LARVVAMPQCKKLSQKEMAELIVDATEQPIERPKKNQNPYYSGKKKRHTLKTEIRVNLKGRIVQISKTHPGSVHDFNIFKQEPPLPNQSRTYIDSGYQGIDQRHHNTDFPYKVTKKTFERAGKRRQQGSFKDTRHRGKRPWRHQDISDSLDKNTENKRKRDNIKFRIIAEIVNLKNGVAKA